MAPGPGPVGYDSIFKLMKTSKKGHALARRIGRPAVDGARHRRLRDPVLSDTGETCRFVSKFHPNKLARRDGVEARRQPDRGPGNATDLHQPQARRRLARQARSRSGRSAGTTRTATRSSACDAQRRGRQARCASFVTSGDPHLATKTGGERRAVERRGATRAGRAAPAARGTQNPSTCTLNEKSISMSAERRPATFHLDLHTAHSPELATTACSGAAAQRSALEALPARNARHRACSPPGPAARNDAPGSNWRQPVRWRPNRRVVHPVAEPPADDPPIDCRVPTDRARLPNFLRALIQLFTGIVALSTLSTSAAAAAQAGGAAARSSCSPARAPPSPRPPRGCSTRRSAADGRRPPPSPRRRRSRSRRTRRLPTPLARRRRSPSPPAATATPMFGPRKAMAVELWFFAVSRSPPPSPMAPYATPRDSAAHRPHFPGISTCAPRSPCHLQVRGQGGGGVSTYRGSTERRQRQLPNWGAGGSRRS